MTSFNPYKKFKSSFNSVRILRIIPWIWLTVGYCFTVSAFCLNGRHLLDSDMSSEMVLASQLNKEGSILSTNWFYSTELRVLNTQLIYKIGLLFFPDWHMARSFSIAVLLLLFLACYLFLTKELRLGNIGVWTAGTLIFPFSAIYENIVLYGCYYIPHISISFLTLGLIIKIVNSKAKQKKIRLIAILAIISFAAGLGGIRQLLVCYIPALLTALLLLWRPACSISKPREIGTLPEFAVLKFSITAFLFGSFGYLVNVLILHKVYTFTSYGSQKLSPFSFSDFLNMAGKAVSIFGYSGCDSLFSKDGIAALCGLVLTGLLLLAFVYGLLHFRMYSNEKQFVFLFAFLAFWINVVFCSLSNQTVDRYLLPSAIFAFPVFGIVLSEENIKSRMIREIPVLLLALCVTIQGCCICYIPAVEGRKETSGQEQVEEWLVDHNHLQGYATYWNGNIMTELSNGKIEVWSLEPGIDNDDWNKLKFFEQLQVKSHENNLPSGPVFLVLSQKEYTDPKAIACADKSHLAYCKNGYAVYLYDNANDLLSRAQK